MAFSVIRFSWDYVASLRFPFLRGPSAIMKQNRPSAALRPRFFALHRTYESKLSTVRHSTKKALNFRRALLLYRDSVGIRTQDPQLRRLLLYPTELPNRSVIFEGANISQILGIDKQKCGKVRKLLLERLESLCLLLI